ncbi:MAG TPA: hypothetical protein VFX02_11015 [Gammaproteobacteria bacterium]|nr:hypothetical protein [Gammaproteobacteria bacterium]
MNANLDTQQFEIHSNEGARMIIDYCAMLAVRIGVNLKNVYWDPNREENTESHTLNIEAESGAVKLDFVPRDIASFNARVGTEKTQKKLKKALFDIQAENG